MGRDEVLLPLDQDLHRNTRKDAGTHGRRVVQTVRCKRHWVKKSKNVLDRQMCFWNRFFFVHLLKLDGKSLSMISKGSGGSIPKSEALVGLGGSYLVGNWWILSSDEDFHWWFRNLASKPIAEWRICMNLLKTNGWNTQPLAVCRCVFFPTGEFFQLLC